ncbi:MAG: MBOAT family protein [Burkholderiales bacterium]|nr:MBOAT family protein [Burkholderiales bacterium]
MLFTSLDFFLFLAACVAGFVLLPARWRFGWLLAASCAFYGWADPWNLAWLGAVTAVVLFTDAATGRMESPGARRKAFVAAIVLLVGSLAALKFHDFAAAEAARLAGVQWPRIGVAAPAGFSFYVFGAVAYLADRNRGLLDSAPARDAALLLAWFPKILAGPIERGTRLLPQLARGALRATPQQVVLGAQLIGWGLIKKVVIADNLAPFVDRTFAIANYASPVDLLLAVYFFAFQIYCDFSGYTDIAIGVSLLFGIELAENFRRPYLSRSTAEFWSSRWHVSLGQWFRDYVYIPLGGSEAGAMRRYANVMLVFIVSGLWHAGLGWGVGWTFLAWGAINGACQWAGIATRPAWARLAVAWPRVSASTPWLVLRVLLTFHLILASWVFFRAKTLQEAWTILQRIGSQAVELPALLARYPFSAEQKLGMVLVAILVAVEILDERQPILARLRKAPVALRWAAGYAGLVALLVLGHWQSRQFIYMQF